MAWCFSYFFDSFASPFPWLRDDSLDVSWGVDAAAAEKVAAKLGPKMEVKSHDLWNPDYFHKTILNSSSHIAETGSLQPRIVFCMFLSYFVCYFASWKGLKATGKVLWVTCTLPYVLLTILLIKGLTLEGCGRGLHFLLVPNWSQLTDIKVWEAAVVQIIYSSGVSFGTLTHYASARGKTEKILPCAFWIPLANSATSFYAALVVFTFLGHVSFKLDVEVKDVVTQGADLVFVAYPGILDMLYGKNFWAILFFLMLLTLGVDSVFGMYDFYMQYMADLVPWFGK